MVVWSFFVRNSDRWTNFPLVARRDRAGKEDGAGLQPELEQEACHWAQGRGSGLRYQLEKREPLV